MASLPPWAYKSNTLPPWHGNVTSRPTIGKSGVAPGAGTGGSVFRPPQANVAKGVGGNPITNNTVNVKPAPVAPTNPWLESGANKPIYGDTAPDTSMIDRLMAELNAKKGAPPVNFSSGIERVTPTERIHERSGDMNTLLSELNDWSKTGGFSNADLANIRARGVSPIRSIYANAQRGMDRQKSLQGGYAPGIGAASSRMAREMSEQLASKSTDLEAGIAEMVQKGREGALGRRGELLNSEEGRIAGFTDANAGGVDNANIFNATAFNDAKMKEAAFNADRDNQYTNQALQLAQLREQILGANKSGQLTERNTSRAGNLDWQRSNDQTGKELIDAIMNQYNTGSTRR